MEPHGGSPSRPRGNLARLPGGEDQGGPCISEKEKKRKTGEGGRGPGRYAEYKPVSNVKECRGGLDDEFPGPPRYSPFLKTFFFFFFGLRRFIRLGCFDWRNNFWLSVGYYWKI